VDEIVANRFSAENPEHPASFFAAGVKRKREEIEEDLLCVQLNREKLQMAQLIRSMSETPAVLAYAEELVKEVTLPGGSSVAHFVDAATYLRERSHTDDNISRLAGEFGKALIFVKERMQINHSCTLPASHGPEEKNIRQYHRRWDAVLLDQTYECFKRGALYQRVVTDTQGRRAIHNALQ